MTAAVVLRSAAFNVAYVTITLLMLILGLPLLISRRLVRRYVRCWAGMILLLLRVLCGLRYEVRGENNITSQPAIYASKHQSAWDIFILLTLLPAPMFVLKRELLWIPLVGWYMRRFGIIAINRGKGTAALRAMAAKAKQALHARSPLVIYPEGTRKTPGAEPDYLPGVALLYGQLMVEVVPVALNSGVFWGRNAFIKKPGTIMIEFLPAIPPGLPARELMTSLQGVIEDACKRLSG